MGLASLYAGQDYLLGGNEWSAEGVLTGCVKSVAYLHKEIIRTHKQPAGHACLPANVFTDDFSRASGEAFLGTQWYLFNTWYLLLCSRLRRGDFRYTTIHVQHKSL